ncbi:MAG: carbon-nitrogen hydrolase family protein [Pseudomonadota bacterium]
MRVGLVQLTAGDDPTANAVVADRMIRQAAAEGAQFVATPEVTNCLSSSRTHQESVLQHEADDATLAMLRETAKALGIWLSIGSLALKTDDADGRFANRSFLIGPDAAIAARYDKIHMFDVTVSETESYRESAGYRPGDKAVVAETPLTVFGLSVCYDLRFAYLYRALAQAGAEVLLVPAAFSATTGKAHWEVLLRARAIETGCFVIAAGQTGAGSGTGALRETYGHSLVVAPWGEVLVDAGTDHGVVMVDLDLDEVSKARGRIAALTHDRAFSGP